MSGPRGHVEDPADLDRDLDPTSTDADALGEDPDLDDADREALAVTLFERGLVDDPLLGSRDMVGLAGSFDDVAELTNVDERHQRPSRWGRLDLSVAWRRSWNQDSRDDGLWLVATWRR